MSDFTNLKNLLDESAARYNRREFIVDDPVSIPHRYTTKQDIEISGFFAAVLAWGRRNSIIGSTLKILELMDHAPHQFIVQHTDTDLIPFTGFVHRTFNATDLLYFISLLKHHYLKHNSLEDAFAPTNKYTSQNVESALLHFHHYFFSLDHPERTRKHIATPARNSACKRLNMFLRWMVRNDGIVDFGLWTRISPAQLICPLDVHVCRVAHHFGLLENNKSNWQNAIYLTDRLKEFRPDDPVIYDFALFGLGVARHL